jgi:hypothetical protein
MEIKGTAIKTTRDFVKSTFPTQYDTWIESLPDKTKALYASKLINMAGWYPMKDAYQIPMESLIQLFYDGNTKIGAETLGRFSADMALTGIYKLYLLVATPKYLMQRASTVFSTFYNPCEIVVTESGDKKVTMVISNFPEMTPSIEYRIAGWCIRALELCGCKNSQYTISLSLTKSNPCTEIVFSWE